MGVMVDYFRSVSEDAARETRHLAGGPLGTAGQQAGFDGVETKGVFPDPHLELLLAAAAGVAYERGPQTAALLWPPPDTPDPTDETSIWLTDPSIYRLSTRVRDGLAGIEAERAGVLAVRWIGELGPGFSDDQVAEMVAALADLARRAAAAGQGLYCWSAM